MGTGNSDITRVFGEGLDFPPQGAETGHADLSALKLFMLGHAHIDLAYRWDYRETIHRIAPWTFRGVLDLMARMPDVTFCQSQAYLYDAMEREYPALFSAILAKIREGRWEFIGGSWCEFDAILPGGESIVRQYLHGMRYAEERLGVHEHNIAFVPDSFCGHAATLPQILAGCGFQVYIFGRGLPQDPAHPVNTRRAFVWHARDGSTVVGYLPFGSYSTPPLTDEILAGLLPYAKASVDPQELVLYGVGDHGGGPRDADIQALETLVKRSDAPRWQFGTASAYCKTVFTKTICASLSRYQGNLGGYCTGALTSQARMKRNNRLLERLLLGTEAMAVIGTMLQRKPAFPRVDFREIWREYLTHQFHDVLPGTSIAAVYRDVARSHRRIRNRLLALRDDAIIRIAARLDTRSDGYSLIVFNPAPRSVKALVRTVLPRHVVTLGISAQLMNLEGCKVETDCRRRTMSFRAELPALGYELFRLVPSKRKSRATSQPALSFRSHTLHTPFYRIRFDPRTGDIVSLMDHALSREQLRGPSNTLMLWEEDALATSWVQFFTGERRMLKLLQPPEVIEHDRFSIRVATVARTPFSVFTREIVAYRDVPRIDFRVRMDWRESNAFLKIGFAPAFRGPVIVSTSVAFGSVRVDDPSSEFAMQDHVLLQGKSDTLAFFNDGCHAANYKDGVLGISVVRNARDMDPAMDHGSHELRYAMLPMPAGVAASAVAREQADFLSDPLCRWESAHAGVMKPWDADLPAIPARRGFIGVDAPNVEISAFKMPDEVWTPTALVVRLRELDGVAVNCTVSLPAPVLSAVRTDHLERQTDQVLETSGEHVHLSLAPYQLISFMAILPLKPEL